MHRFHKNANTIAAHIKKSKLNGAVNSLSCKRPGEQWSMPKLTLQGIWLRKNSLLTFVTLYVTNSTTRTPLLCGLMYAQKRISVYSEEKICCSRVSQYEKREPCPRD